MAAAAETLNRQTDEFDWDFAEAQFDVPSNYERPPEREVYGRSLSTIHRLGKVAVKMNAAEATRSPEADQVRVEFFTSVKEGLGTDSELGGGLEVRDFDTAPVLAGKVMSKDLKTAVTDMTAAGLICAEITAKKDKYFIPQLTRTKWDHDNAMTVNKMVRGETSYNTRIVISPFPEEAAAQSSDAYWRKIGYVPHLRRGFVQLYHMTESGLVTGSLSFDGSDKERLREIFSQFNIDIPQTEITDNWLQYAIADTLTQAEAKKLALSIADLATDPMYKKTTNTIDLAREYQIVMSKVFDESYIHVCESQARGYQTPATRALIMQLTHHAKHFNQQYAQSLYKMQANKHEFTDTDMAVIHDLLVYSTIEMVRALHFKSAESALNNLDVDIGWANKLVAAQLHELSQESLHQAIGGFAGYGARSNRGYSACGLEIAPGNDQAERNNPQTVFGGNVDRGRLAWAGGRTHKGRCVNCHEVTEVGVKNWCKACISGHCGSKK